MGTTNNGLCFLSGSFHLAEWSNIKQWLQDVPFCSGDRGPISCGGDGGGEVGAGKRGFTGSTMSPMKPAGCGLAMERQASPTTERRKGGGVSGKKFFLGIQSGKLKGSVFFFL